MNEFVRFNGEALGLVRDVNIPEAKSMLDRVLLLTDTRAAQSSKRTLGNSVQPLIEKTRTALRNIFGILVDANMEPYEDVDTARLAMLRSNVRTVRRSFDEQFQKIYMDRPNPVFAAWASNDFKDTAIYFTRIYFDQLSRLDQAVTLVHERSHTALKLPGHPGTGDGPSCVVPHEGMKRGFGDVPITFSHAIKNAYCYEWLSISLHPMYNPVPYRDACAAPSTTP